MTRFLSQVLGVPELQFGQNIEQLERASGRPAADIRLSTELRNQLRVKIVELGLDPHDTTGPELYAALIGRLHVDEQRVRQALNISPNAAANDVLSRVQQFLQAHDMPRQCFALKASVAKRLLKKRVPKIAMKRLGYRSADSMLKHEPLAQIYAAARMFESSSWWQSYDEQYNALQPGDFESRDLQVLHPTGRNWPDVAAQYVPEAHHNMLYFKELAAVVLLPLQADVDGLALTTLLLTLHYLNDIRAYGTYLKIQLVQPAFGSIVRQTLHADPQSAASIADQPVSWRVIQRYFGQAHGDQPEAFGPHVQADDFAWIHGEHVLTELEPALAFWRDTQGLGMLHDGQPVSCNALDIALSYCNHLPFADRIVHFVRDNVWHELMMRYLHEDHVEAMVSQQLARDLVDNEALA